MTNLMALLPDHFPDQDLYERYSRLWKQATEHGPLTLGDTVYQGKLEHTLRRRRRSTLERYAEEVLDIYHEIERRRCADDYL